MEVLESEISASLLRFRKRLLRSVAIRLLEHGVPARIVTSVTNCTQSWVYQRRKEMMRSHDGS